MACDIVEPSIGARITKNVCASMAIDNTVIHSSKAGVPLELMHCSPTNNIVDTSIGAIQLPMNDLLQLAIIVSFLE
ncbi:MAG: hypothetical protein HRO68_10120 [Nitrosopumilus sp.]|nr:hypothetical protein [Nitrosopumilus sp.]